MLQAVRIMNALAEQRQMRDGRHSGNPQPWLRQLLDQLQPQGALAADAEH